MRVMRKTATVLLLAAAGVHALNAPLGRLARTPRRHGAPSPKAVTARAPRHAAVTAKELSFVGAESEADEVCILLPLEDFAGEYLPVSFVGAELQLEELENDEKMITGLVLNPDGSVTHGETTGPPPVSCCGLWQSGGGQFQMTLQRTFQTMSIEYTVTRIFIGELEEAESGPSDIRGRMELLTSLRQEELAARKASSPASVWDGEVCCLPPTRFSAPKCAKLRMVLRLAGAVSGLVRSWLLLDDRDRGSARDRGSPRRLCMR